MTSEFSIDMNGAYCHGYQIVYKTLEFRKCARNSTSSKSVNGLARRLGGISPRTTEPIPTNRRR